MRQKLVLGGIGGLTPLCASLLVLDVSILDTYIRQLFDPHTRGELYLLGYTSKALMLFLVGAFWAYLHRSEPSALKIYQLGIVAPAIIVGFINTAEIRQLTPKGRVEKTITSLDMSPNSKSHARPSELTFRLTQLNAGAAHRSFWIRTAEAAEGPCPPNTCRTAKGSCSPDACAPSWFDKITYGFLSRPAPRLITCNEVPVKATIPYASSATVNIQSGPTKNCTFSVDGATAESGVVLSCTRVNGSVTVPKGYIAGVTETNDACFFNVQGAR